MEAPTVSVIIPVYQAERFFDECLDSVLEQDYPALEVILVDDGSPDSCPERCDRYAEACDFVTAIHTKNQGPGMARNTGLEAATGRYVAFVDSDDRLDGPDAIRRMVEQAEKKQADIVVGAYRRMEGERAGGTSRFRFPEGKYTGTVDFRFRGFVLYNHLVTPWCKLYRRAFLADHHIRYRDYHFLEDKFFNMICCAHRPVYASVKESVYLYRVGGDSLSSRYYEDHITVCVAVASDFQRFLSARGMAEEFDDLVAFQLGFGLFFLTAQELTRKGIRETAKALSGYGRDPLVRKMVGRLVRGRYLDQIKSWRWRAAVWGASLLCSLNAYRLLALGVWLLRKAKIDQRLTRAKYEP